MKDCIFGALMILSLFFNSCTQSDQTETTSMTQTNKEMVIKTNDELFHQGNLPFADQAFAGDPAGIKEMVERIKSAFPDIQVVIDPVIGEGNKTAWLRTHTGTHQGEFMGFEPSNEVITWKTMVISEYTEDGKISKEWGVSDLYEVLQKQNMKMHSEKESPGE